MAFNPIKGLESFAPEKPERPDPEMEKLQLKERFEQSVKGKFDILENARFASGIEGVDSLLTVVPRPRPGQEAPDSLNVVVGYSLEDGKKRFSTIALGGDGMMHGNLDAALKRRGVTSLDVYRELMDDLERLNLKKWHVVEGVGLTGMPFRSVFDEDDEAKKKGGSGWQEGRFDEERLKHLEVVMSQPDALFGVKEKAEALHEGDHAVVFPDYLLIENPVTDHAIYLIDIPAIDLASIPKGKKEFDEWLKMQKWFALLGGERKELKQQYKAKTRQHQGSWKEWIDKQCQERRNKRSAARGA